MPSSADISPLNEMGGRTYLLDREINGDETSKPETN